MQIDILTIFPNFFNSPLNTSILKRAIEKNQVSINILNIRDFSENKHKKVDDIPYGGGCGMVMKPEPIFKAYESIKKLDNFKTILVSPQGKVFNQSYAKDLSLYKQLIFICGHYEGIDERVKNIVTDEISIGDYILTGGELSALVIIDSVVRLLPNVLGNQESWKNDSFSDGLLDYPHYTRPREFRNMKVPEVLLSGNHQEINKWRYKQKLKNTFINRPDLINKLNLNSDDIKILNDIKEELKINNNY
ncbi:MAG: tRNA (guanine-N(1)-)-methyltransferase [Candidatus Sericytochromatia bacterium]|nr:MAG: tRNA (guanine-N(1)-)-methyltransferase [Candidatus Sericytochromatia bacterium]